MTNWNKKYSNEKTAFDVHTVLNGLHQVFHALDPIHKSFNGDPDTLHHLQEQAQQADQGMSTSPWVQNHLLQRYIDNHTTTNVDVPKLVAESAPIAAGGAMAYFKNRKKLRQYKDHLVECHGYDDLPRALYENNIEGEATSPTALSNLHEHDHLYNSLGEYEHTHYPFGYQGK